MPKISVIMPCFNHVQYVADSIKSVLDSTENDLELIVVDDASTDNSRVIIEKATQRDSRVKAIYHSVNAGASAARNSALKIASGEYIAFCDADDLWKPDKLERQFELLTAYPSAGVAYGDAKIIDDAGKENGQCFKDFFEVPGNGSGPIFKTLCIRNWINIATVLIRRENLSGLFDPEIKLVEDWWFWLLLAKTTDFAYDPEPLAFYRVHSANSVGTTQSPALVRNRIKVYQRILQAFPTLPRSVTSWVFYHIGVARQILGERTDARQAYGQALRTNPVNAKALIRYSLCALRK